MKLLLKCLKKMQLGLRRPTTQGIMRFLVDFIKKTPLHVLVRSDIHWLELVFWIIVVIISTILAVRFSFQVLHRYPDRNSIISIRRNYMSFETLLPAFTFCPHEVLDENKVTDFINKNPYPDVSIQDAVEILRAFATRTVSSDDRLSEHNYAWWVDPNAYMELFGNLSVHHTIVEKNTGKRGIRIITEIGLCYIFNTALSKAVKAENWGYYAAQQTNHDSYRSPSAPAMVSFHQNFPIENIFTFDDLKIAFSLYVHSPYNLPTKWMREVAVVNTTEKKSLWIPYRVIPIGCHTQFLSSSTMLEKSCRTLAESDLQMFPHIYTESLCLIECHARNAIALCGCIPHFYAHKKLIKFYSSLPICTTLGLNCLSKYSSSITDTHGNSEIPFRCNCLPNCEDVLISYNVKWKENSGKQKKIQFSLMYAPILQFQRNTLFSYMDHAVSVGNVLSAFLGFSLIGGAEFIYYFTLRIYWYRRGYRRDLN